MRPLASTSDYTIGASPLSGRPLPAVPGTQRKLVQTRNLKLPTGDGRTIRVQVAEDSRGGGRPPVAAVLYDKDRPVVRIEYKYKPDGARWEVVSSRASMLDAAGRVTLVVDRDYSGLRWTTRADGRRSFRRIGFSRSFELVRR